MNNKFPLALALIAVLTLAVIGVAAAQGLTSTIDRQVFSGGGAPASGGDVSLNGSLGQTITGLSSSSGGTQLNAGYWQGPTSYRLMLPLVVR